MQHNFSNLSDLEIKYIEENSNHSSDNTSTATFQIVSRNKSECLMQVHNDFKLDFQAFYNHNGQFYPHPYTLKMVKTLPTFPGYHLNIYNVFLYVKLKRLQNFDITDLERYYEFIDGTIHNKNENLCDFHDLYLFLVYVEKGKQSVYKCNEGLPITLPKISSHVWTHKNTSIRFRYDAENRDSAIPCEFTLHHDSLVHLQSYKVFFCLTTNTIPPYMDYHAIRWTCKLRQKSSKQKEASIRKTDKEKIVHLNHPSGIVLAQVYGPERKFTPYMFYSNNKINYVRSLYELRDFQGELTNPSRDKVGFTIAVIKAKDYPNRMRNRRIDENIVRYLPFNEFDNINVDVNRSDKEIIEMLKNHKEQRNQQLMLQNNSETPTHSQAHVRLYVAAYDENDILLTESLYPPLRNNKLFEPLNIIRIVQSHQKLQAKQTVFVYCDYDRSRTRSEYQSCPYEFELSFTNLVNPMNSNELTELFTKTNIRINADFVPNCPCLLQFQVPNDPVYDKQRIFLRLRHKYSYDYNPSSIALNGNEIWTYEADPKSIIDSHVYHQYFDNDTQNHTNESANGDLTTHIETIGQEDSVFNSRNAIEDDDQFGGILSTPVIVQESPADFQFFSYLYSNQK